MSGIFGIYDLDRRPVKETDLRKMSDRLSHRGGDAQGIWQEGAVGLGHRMSWVTPESFNEKLPLVWNQNGGPIVLTADARIDNRKELCALLELSPDDSKLLSDSEIILHAYLKWNCDCVKRLLGDFAFAVWDERTQTLFCARDHFGIKPFFYYFSRGKFFAFASEIKGLQALPNMPKRLNEEMVADYLLQWQEDAEATFYKQILRLPPAHRMVIQKGERRIESYWKLDLGKEIKFQSDTEYAEAYRDLFQETVRCRLRSAYPVGSMLSGGLDSSSIVCTARNLFRSQTETNPLHTFSNTYEDVPECDERDYMQAVVDEGDLVPHYIRADHISPLADSDFVHWAEEGPYSDPHTTSYLNTYRVAQENRVRVILDGFDGDTTLYYSRALLTDLLNRGELGSLAGEIKSLFEEVPFALALKIFWLRCVKPFVPDYIKKGWRLIRARNNRLFFDDEIHWQEFLNPEFCKRIDFAGRYQKMMDLYSRPAKSLREEQRQYLCSNTGTISLESADRWTASFACEHRYPFYDRRLVEFCLAIPAEQKFRKGWSRIIARHALANILPEKIRWRKGKTAVGNSAIRGLKIFERERIEGVLLKDYQVIEPYVNIENLREAYQQFASAERFEDIREDVLNKIWAAVTLSLWLRETALKP